MEKRCIQYLTQGWLCKYHIVFTPKYRRKIIYNQYRSSLGEIFRRLCTYKGVEII
ncbi:transposase, partial [Streptococcus suis]